MVGTRHISKSSLRRYGFSVIGIFFSTTVFLGIAVFGESHEGELEVDFFDVGQGDAILIQAPTGHTILIDGGRDTTVSRKIAEELPLYDRTIDLVILTHPDLDHVGGLPDVLRRFRVGTIFLPDVKKELAAYQAFLARAGEQDIPLHHVFAGDTLRLGPTLAVHVLAPEKGAAPSADLNNSSIVAILEYNKRSFLFTGDAEDQSERRMMVAWQERLAADILKIGHHGSRHSSSSAFLAAVGAHVGVISAGKNNSYGHPHPDVLARMAEQGMAVYQTDVKGDIEMTSDGEFITILTKH